MPTDATTRDGDGLAKVDNRAPDPETLAPHLLRRRNRIVEAAIELLEDGEYDEIQIRDVAHQAGVALGTLYRYFTSKEHLYAAALLEWARSFELQSIAGRPSRGESDQDRIRALLARAVKAFERWPQMLRAEIAIETSADPNARAIFDEFSRRHISVMTAALRDTPEDTAEAIVRDDQQRDGESAPGLGAGPHFDRRRSSSPRCGGRPRVLRTARRGRIIPGKLTHLTETNGMTERSALVTGAASGMGRAVGAGPGGPGSTGRRAGP